MTTKNKADKRRIEELEQALKVIHTWSGFALEHPTKGLQLLQWIKDKTEEVMPTNN
jgi:hypothetical protein